MVKKAETFEQMFERLEKISKDMEDNELSLDENMKNYEEGIKLCNKLYKILNEAEGKVKIISEKGSDEDFMQRED